MNIITVRINGMDYKLRGEENNEYLQMVGQYVDNKINSLMLKNSKMSRPDATILAAINLGDEVFKNKEAAERANENYKRTAEEQKALISELEGAKLEIESLKNANISLQETAAKAAEVKLDEETKKQLEDYKNKAAEAEEKTAQSEKQIQDLNDEVNYLKEELALMQQTVDELKKNKVKTQGINKKLLSENSKLRYQHMARVRKIEDLTKELEEKNMKLMLNEHGHVPKK